MGIVSHSVETDLEKHSFLVESVFFVFAFFFRKKREKKRTIWPTNVRSALIGQDGEAKFPLRGFYK